MTTPLPYGNSGFKPSDVADIEDFGRVHMYPHADNPMTQPNELQQDIDAVKTLKPAGQPIVVDETWTLNAGADIVKQFIYATRLRQRDGWGTTTSKPLPN